MSSGYGLHGPGRCFPIWRDFAACMVKYGGPEGEPSKCGELREDYFECLHHRKEKNRLRYLNDIARLQKQQAERAASAADAH